MKIYSLLSPCRLLGSNSDHEVCGKCLCLQSHLTRHKYLESLIVHRSAIKLICGYVNVLFNILLKKHGKYILKIFYLLTF